MAEDTFALGGGSVIVTSSGVYTAESNMPRVMKTGMLKMKSKWTPYFFVLRGDLRSAIFRLSLSLIVWETFYFGC